jgi:hypothetical protein
MDSWLETGCPSGSMLMNLAVTLWSARAEGGSLPRRALEVARKARHSIEIDDRSCTCEGYPLHAGQSWLDQV